MMKLRLQSLNVDFALCAFLLYLGFLIGLQLWHTNARFTPANPSFAVLDSSFFYERDGTVLAVGPCFRWGDLMLLGGVLCLIIFGSQYPKKIRRSLAVLSIALNVLLFVFGVCSRYDHDVSYISSLTEWSRHLLYVRTFVDRTFIPGLAFHFIALLLALRAMRSQSPAVFMFSVLDIAVVFVLLGGFTSVLGVLWT